MKLSILIPSISERLKKLRRVILTYEIFINKYHLWSDVEILSLCDNRMRTIGRKRTDLINLAMGDYIVMSDEDDFLTENYFELILPEIEKGVDVITYNQFARINREYSIVHFAHNNQIEDFNKSGITKRPAWHCCTWRREIVKDIKFEEKNWGEDHAFQELANQVAKTTSHIPEICHIYEHDSHLTTAFQ